MYELGIYENEEWFRERERERERESLRRLDRELERVRMRD